MEYLVALGANLPGRAGDPAAALDAALRALAAAGATRITASPVYRSPAFPAGSGPDYANGAARVWLEAAPEGMLALLHRIEAAADRARQVRWGARTLDLDLIAAGQTVLPDPVTQRRVMQAGSVGGTGPPPAPDRLILPHPRLQERAFVLVPLCDIAPEWRHPVLGHTARALRDALPAAERAALRLWSRGM